jgi:hypothetical protein
MKSITEMQKELDERRVEENQKYYNAIEILNEYNEDCVFDVDLALQDLRNAVDKLEECRKNHSFKTKEELEIKIGMNKNELPVWDNVIKHWIILNEVPNPFEKKRYYEKRVW